jgi:hypothetical protein
MARPGVVRRGTARDLADHDAGYSANGESEHSRRAASAPNFTTRSHVARTKGKHTSADLIAENKSLLAKLRGEILTETNPARLAKLRRNLEIKSRFVAKLESEQ